MSDRTDTAERGRIVVAIASALGEVLGHEVTSMTEDSKLFDELGLDSSSAFELLMRLEESLDVEFDTDTLEMGHFASVGTLADFIMAENAD